MHRRRARTYRMLLPLLLPASAVSCARSGDGGAAAELSRMTGVVDLSLGTAEGDDAVVFGSITGLAADDQGRIYVADAQASEVRVFAADGTFLFRIGRSGSGPGELLRPCCLAVDEEGRLWVRDTGNGRYNAYDIRSDGAYTTQLRMAHGDSNYGATLTFDAERHLVDVGHGFTEGTGARDLYRHHLDASGAVVREHALTVPGPSDLGAHIVERTTPTGRSMSFIYPPYGPSHFIAHASGGGWAEAVSSEYEVQWYDAGGNARVIRRSDVTGPPVSARERAVAEERVAEQLAAAGAAPGDARFRVPDRKQPLANVFFDQAGRLWVQRAVHDGADPEADIWGDDGTLVAQVSWPRGIQLSRGWIGDTTALGTRQDELGTPQVVRLLFVRQQ